VLELQDNSIESLAQQWAKKYMHNLQVEEEETPDPENLALVVSAAGRARTSEVLLQSLRTASVQSWNKTEALLSKEVKRHRIDPKLIDPWDIAADAFKIYQKVLDVYTQQAPLRQLSMVMKLARSGEPLYQKALKVYTEQVAPSQLAKAISSEIGAMRQKYTKKDPRVIGFVSMQFHYTSQILLNQLSPLERTMVTAYFKVIDDHLYMPLQRAYTAAAALDYESPALKAVQKLLPYSTEIAKKICQRVIANYPTYRCYSGALSDAVIQVSTIRDIEMFQVYLWVCGLEGSIAAIQQELFPLCVMIYPVLNVQWELIRQMLHLLGQEIRDRLDPQEAESLMPYFQVLWQMFSPEVFIQLGLEKKPSRNESYEWESLFA